MPTTTLFRHSMLGGALLLAATSYGQAPTVVTTDPARAAAAAPRTSAPSVTFSQAVTGAANLRLFGSQWRGFRAGSGSGDGTSTLRWQPAQVFAPGEQLQLTVPTSVRSSGNQALGGGYVVNFRAAAGPAAGTFAGTTSYPISGNTSYNTPVLADINNDGKLDVLINNGFDAVFLRLGDGQGGFGAASTVFTTPLGDSPRGMAVGDLNNDGNLDLLTALIDVNYTLSLRLGTGTGSFGTPVTLSTGVPVLAPQLADINGDGNQDVGFLLVRPTTTPAGPASATLVCLMGNGQGVFATTTSLALPAGARALLLHDLNNDGRLDALVGNPATNQVLSYLGNGQGSFAAATTAPVSASGEGFDLADLTADGIPDLVAVDNGAGLIRVHPGTGQGDFAAASTTATAAGIRQVTCADVNGDGRLDLLGWVAPSAYGNINLWLNNGSGAFPTSSLVETGAQTVAVGDVNGNGTLDLALTDLGSNSLKIRLNPALATAPAISGFGPASGPAGTAVTVTGSNFSGATAVLVGGVSVPFTLTPAGTITFAVPTAIPHGLISVITPTGMSTSAQAFGLVLSARTAPAALLAAVYPNPAQGQAQLQLPTGTGPVRATLYNSLGQAVRSVSLSPTGAGAATLDLRSLPAAVYTLRLQSGTQSSAQALVVE